MVRVKSGLRSSVLEISRWATLRSRVVGVDSDQIENSQRSTAWERAGILNISKSIKLWVKLKNVSFILQKI